MARADQIREELARWRLCFGLLVAIGASLTGWVIPQLAHPVSDPPEIGGVDILSATLIVLAVVSLLAFVVYVAMMRKTNELGDIE